MLDGTECFADGMGTSCTCSYYVDAFSLHNVAIYKKRLWAKGLIRTEAKAQSQNEGPLSAWSLGIRYKKISKISGAGHPTS